MEENKETQVSHVLKKIVRDENGLIQGFDYKYTEDGLIDWKALVPSKYLYVNNDPKKKEKIEEKYGKSYVEIDPIKDKVDDADLVVMLGGLREILRLRGYESVDFCIKEAKEDYAAVNCMIRFIPNVESEMRAISFAENACAHFNNTSGFGRNYLVELATNRALCRCVRSFLNLGIVSREELGGGVVEEAVIQNSSMHIEKLQKEMKSKEITWEQLKVKLTTDTEKKKYPDLDISKCKSEADLPKEVIFSLLERLKKLDKEKK